MRTAIWVQLEREWPPRHLPAIGPESTVAEAIEALPEAFGLNGDADVVLSYGETVLAKPETTLASYGVPPEALLRGRFAKAGS